MSKIARCGRCNRRLRNAEGWNVTYADGIPVGFLCPNCQTPEENAEAEINEATLDYTAAKIDQFGRLSTPSKSWADQA